MSKKIVTFDSSNRAVVKTENLSRLIAHLKMAADLVDGVKDQDDTLTGVYLEEAQQIIARHHHQMFINANQREPGEADQQQLDYLTKSLLKQLFE